MAAASSAVCFPSLSTNHISSLQSRNYLRFPKLFKPLSIKCTSTKSTLKIDAINDSDSSAQNKTLREICKDKVPHHILNRVEELGFLIPTDVQEQSLPIMLSGSDCILQAQTGSGKTLAYLLPIFASITGRRASVQAVIVVPTRELGMQVAKVARAVASPSNEGILEKQNVISIMALLDGGTLKRQSTWLRAEPPQLVVATLGGLSQMVEKGRLKLDALRTLVIDEVDSIFGSDTQVSMLRKVLTSYSSSMKRQTILASASIPQHRRFVHNCIQHKWTKRDVVHVHVHPIEPMPSRLTHRYVACQKDEKYKVLLSLIISDAPKSAIVFINEQSIKSKKLGEPPTAETILEFLRESYGQTSGGKSHNDLEVSVLDESMNINERTTALSDMRKGSCVLIATDLAARGLDIPETSHIYNFDLPKSAIHYIHRAGRSGRKPFSEEKCIVTNLLTKDELFVLKQFENTLLFDCHEICSSICP